MLFDYLILYCQQWGIMLLNILCLAAGMQCYTADTRCHAVRLSMSCCQYINVVLPLVNAVVLQDNRVNGTSVTTRALGNCYLYPQLIPEPHIIKKTLRAEDQFMIIANSSLWRSVCSLALMSSFCSSIII